MKITANTIHGRVLLALRAGQMEYAQLIERFPNCRPVITYLESMGLIEKNELIWQITSAGREACPNRRDATLVPMHARKSASVQQGATA